MLYRDELGIIMQRQDDGTFDGGDSARSTGIMAICGSDTDKDRVELFVTKFGSIVRHPLLPWSDPSLSSRDQLLCLVAGASQEQAKLIEERYKLFINKDILMPDHRLHLKLCAGNDGFLLGYVWLWCSIIWFTKILPDKEINQILCQCIVAGPKYVKTFCKWHPDWEANLKDYWCGWRGMPEVYEAMVRKLGQ